MASPRPAASAVVNGVEKVRKPNPVTVQGALKDTSQAQTFTFSSESTVSCLPQHLSVGPLALRSVSFLVVDAEVAENDELIGQSVLRHLEVDSKKVIKNNRAQLSKTDCSGVVRDNTVSSTVAILRFYLTGERSEEQQSKPQNCRKRRHEDVTRP